jgi:serine acetyltransferase
MKISEEIDFIEFRKDFIYFFKNETNQQEWNKFFSNYFTQEKIIEIEGQLNRDLDFFRQHDPASKLYNNFEILNIRRGMLSILAHRIFSSILKNTKSKQTLFEIEFLAQRIQTITNVEIHPQAEISGNFAIDHGHGTVIGATTIVGDNVFIYHGVTLGATGRKAKNGRRHPLLFSDISLGNGSQILGPSSVGNNVSIGTGAIILDSILEDGVVISPRVLISKVRVPSNTSIVNFLPNERVFIGYPAGSNVLEKISLERIDITSLER